MVLVILTIFGIFIWPMILLYVLYLLYLCLLHLSYLLYVLYFLSFLHLFYFTQISLITYNMWVPLLFENPSPHTGNKKKNNPHLWHGWEWRAHSWDKHVPIGCYLGYLEENIPWPMILWKKPWVIVFVQGSGVVGPLPNDRPFHGFSSGGDPNYLLTGMIFYSKYLVCRTLLPSKFVSHQNGSHFKRFFHGYLEPYLFSYTQQEM